MIRVVDARATAGPLAEEARQLGIRVDPGKAIAKVKGGKRVKKVAICNQEGVGGAREEVECDAVAMSGGWSPVVHMWSHCGGKLVWNEKYAMFQPDLDRPPLGADGKGFVVPAGVAAGSQTDTDFEGLSLFESLRTATEAGLKVVKALGLKKPKVSVPEVSEDDEAPMEPVWLMPANAEIQLRAKSWLDFQNDVKVSGRSAGRARRLRKR